MIRFIKTVALLCAVTAAGNGAAASVSSTASTASTASAAPAANVESYCRKCLE